MPSIFSRIAAGEIPSYKVAEDACHFAFLDISPVHPGHVLVIPKKRSTIFSTFPTRTTHRSCFCETRCKSNKKAIPCTKVGVTVIGLDVPHTHVHLVPMDKGADMNFCAPKLTLPEEQMKEIASKIASCFE